MVIETFTHGPTTVYARLAEKGRMLPDGVSVVSSWVTENRAKCYQVMDCPDREKLEIWMAAWSDIVAFEVVPVISSEEAKSRSM